MNMKSKRLSVSILLLQLACCSLSQFCSSDEHNCQQEEKAGNINTEPLIDCHPDPDPSKSNCDIRGCVWNEDGIPKGAPVCVFPSGFGYRLNGQPDVTSGGIIFKLQRAQHPTLFGNDIEDVLLEVEFQSDYRLRVKFSDPATSRYEVPLKTNDPTTSFTDDRRLYDVTWTNQPQFGLKVVRRSTGATILDTSTPGFVFSDQFLQITTKLSSDNVYGFGEHNHEHLRHDMGWRRWVMFSKDIPVQHEQNLYGVQPFYQNLEPDGKANGVFFKNSNAMEVALQPRPSPAITYRTIGGILDFYIYLGPTPEQVVKQHTEAVGRPLMIPYWGLGFMLSRWGYNNSEVLDHVIKRNRQAGIPMDVQFGDIDYMFEELDFTYDRKTFGKLPEIIDDLHQNGQKFIAILDPAIGCDSSKLERARSNSPGLEAYEDGLARGVYIADSTSGQPLVGEVWPGQTVFPDFTNDNTEQWWRKWIEYFYRSEGVKFDGLWIDMNEPASFVKGSRDGCAENKWNNPPFLPGLTVSGDETRESLFKTICMDSQQKWGRHYDVHSLYAHSEAQQTYSVFRQIFPKKRPMVLTRSNYPGTSKYAIHWLGDNTASWEHLRESIVGILEYSMFGFSVTGPDICGFFDETSEELCTRWMVLGAFYPFSRNHNALNNTHKDPAAYGDKLIHASRKALLTRYKLLPYLYTLVHLASTTGSTVARPLFHEYPEDKITWGIDSQFMWGSSLLISPALEKNQRTVRAYFPNSTWYNYYTGRKDIGATDRDRWLSFPTPLDSINLHIRGGSVIPWQTPSSTTVSSRLNPYGLIVALDADGEANGTLYWDDGETFGTFESGDYLQLEFVVKFDTLKVNVVHNGYPDAGKLNINTVQVFGISAPPTQVMIDGRTLIDSSVSYSACAKTVTLTNLEMSLAAPHRVEWLSI